MKKIEKVYAFMRLFTMYYIPKLLGDGKSDLKVRRNNIGVYFDIYVYKSFFTPIFNSLLAFPVIVLLD